MICHKDIILFSNGLCPIKEYLSQYSSLPHPPSMVILFIISVTWNNCGPQAYDLSDVSESWCSLMLQHSVYLIHLISPHHVGVFCLTLSLEKWVQCSKIFEKRDHIYRTFIIIHCLNCSILIINFLLCLIYKWNLIIGVYV